MHPIGKKTLDGRIESGRAILFCRRGTADDLTFYSRRENEPDFSPLDGDDECFVDDRPKLDPARPEVRRYFAMLLYGGEETRLKTNEVELTVP